MKKEAYAYVKGYMDELADKLGAAAREQPSPDRASKVQRTSALGFAAPPSAA